MEWKAKSHAAYHGYSHLSGIEMTCWFTMWNQSLFRMDCLAGLHRIDAMFHEPLVEVEVKVLLGPQHPGQRLPHDKRLIFADSFRGDGLIELVWFVLLTSLHDFIKALQKDR